MACIATKNPMSSTAHNNLAFALYRRGEFRSAVQHWRRAVKISGAKRADPVAGLALGLDALGYRERARQALAKAIELDSAYGTQESLVNVRFWEPGLARNLMAIK